MTARSFQNRPSFPIPTTGKGRHGRHIDRASGISEQFFSFQVALNVPTTREKLGPPGVGPSEATFHHLSTPRYTGVAPTLTTENVRTANGLGIEVSMPVFGRTPTKYVCATSLQKTV